MRNCLLEVYLDIVQRFLLINHQHNVQDLLHVYHVFLLYQIDEQLYEEDPKEEEEENFKIKKLFIIILHDQYIQVLDELLD